MDLYKILHLDSNASIDDIKKSYKKLSLIYHPDKNINSSDNDYYKNEFIKINHAYEILKDYDKRKKYDEERTLINNNIDINNIIDKIKKIINNTDYIKYIDIIKKKIFLYLSHKNTFNSINIFSIINEINNFKILDIELIYDYTLYEAFNNIPKKIIYERVSKIPFEEYIYPIDKVQIYELEGETIFLNKHYNGNIIIKINIIETEYNDIRYYVLNNDLYAIIKNDNIVDNSIHINYLDDKTYIFTIDDLEKDITEFGSLYKVDGYGLLYYDEDIKYIDNVHVMDDRIKRGNLFFIFLL